MRNKKHSIVILGGLLRKKRDGSWQTNRFNYLRVLAGYYLYRDMKKNNTIKLIASGGKGIYEKTPGVPAVATVMKKELVKLGLLPKEIIEENKTTSTYQELVWITKLLDKNNGEIIVISNDYHLPRIKAMINLIPELKKLKKYVTLISAEKIVVKHDKALKNKINNQRKNPAMKKIIAKEKAGIQALKSGNYKFK